MAGKVISIPTEGNGYATQGHVVSSFFIGHTSIKICDDFCRHDREEIDAILDRIAKRALKAFSVDQSTSS